MTVIYARSLARATNLALAVSLLGCGSDDAPEEETTAAATETTAPATETDVEMSTSGTSEAPTTTDAQSTGPGEGSEGSEGSSGDSAFDEDAVLALAAAYATDLEQINATPFGSQHGLADTVNVFVTPEHAAAFDTLDPAAPSLVEFVEGTLIVKEHLDGDGAYDGYLLMYKAPEGYNPDAADWYWARVTASGNAPNTGTVGFCINCHAQVAETGYVFGVETDNRQ